MSSNFSPNYAYQSALHDAVLIEDSFQSGDIPLTAFGFNQPTPDLTKIEFELVGVGNDLRSEPDNTNFYYSFLAPATLHFERIGVDGNIRGLAILRIRN